MLRSQSIYLCKNLELSRLFISKKSEINKAKEYYVTKYLFISDLIRLLKFIQDCDPELGIGPANSGTNS